MSKTQNTSLRSQIGKVAAACSLIAIAGFYVPLFSLKSILGELPLCVTDMYSVGPNRGGVYIAAICSIVLIICTIIQFFKSYGLLSLLSAFVASFPLYIVFEAQEGENGSLVDLKVGFLIALVATVVLLICSLMQYVDYIRSMRHPGRVAIIGLLMLVFPFIARLLPYSFVYVLAMVLAMFAIPAGILMLVSALLGAIFSRNRRKRDDTAAADQTVQADNVADTSNVENVGNITAGPDTITDTPKTGSGTGISGKVATGIAIVILFVLAGIFWAKREKSPFVGTWRLYEESKTPEGYVDAVYKYTLRLDFNDASVKNGETERVLGIIYAIEDCAGYAAETEDIIMEAKTRGNTAYIKYRHQETGEIWSATLTYDKEKDAVTFVNGEMLEKGPGTPPDDAPVYASDFEGRIFYTEPDCATLLRVDLDPNYVFVTDGESEASENETDEALNADADAAHATEETVQDDTDDSAGQVELSDRIFYAEYSEGTDMQLKCRFKETGEVIELVDNEGNSPLLSYGICWAWPTSDGSGALIVSGDGGTDTVFYKLIKVDADNRLEVLDDCSGFTFNYIMQNSLNAESPSIERVEDKIVVKLAGENGDETHYYDMSGNRL